MRIYNTLSKTKEELVPLNGNNISIYVCGPTVYDFIHIGNARPMIVFDSLRRYLIYKGYNVKYVSNFTDVDDKIIKKANEEKKSSQEISEMFIKECKEDMKNMNVLEADVHPKATEEISGMIELIKELIKEGYAYEINGTVYYKTRNFKEYGKLSHKNLDDLISGQRSLLVSGKDEKEDSLDFVLWKPKKEGEPYWDSPWGEGRPGWHTECSVMARKYLGQTIDIHAGGEDLIFPHHENEIAQSEAVNKKTFARYWMHNAFLNIDNRKMSKSEGNFFTVREISKKVDLNALRFFMLSAHYRTPLNFTFDLVKSAQIGLDRIINCVRNISYELENPVSDSDFAEEIESYKKSFEEKMDDDLNTADAIAVIFELVKFINNNIKSANKDSLIKVKSLLIDLCEILGVKVVSQDEIVEEEILDLINQRNEARESKDYKKADEIRDILKQKGIILEDTTSGVKWKRL